MKRVFLKSVAIAIIAMVTMSMSTFAQAKGDMAVGGNVVVGLDDSYTNFGLGPKFQYNVTDPIRLEASFTYFLKKDNVSMWDLSVNAHYLFPIADQIKVYPLAGLGVLGAKADKYDIPGYGSVGGGSNTEFGFNLGGGIDFNLTDKLFLNAELKYKIGDNWDRFLISAGFGYRF